MDTLHIFYNPLADNRNGKRNAEKLAADFPDRSIVYTDMTAVADLFEEICAVPQQDTVVVCGGDGTLNRMINSFGDRRLSREVYYFAGGSGNDFLADIKDREDRALILLNPYLENLPVVTVNGKTSRFLNGVGYGIDGYCCEEGDRLRAQSDKPIDYTSIAIKGLLFHFRRVNATVTVDGVKHSYRKVWLAPTMNGRFYGGGMMIAPAQDRLNPENNVTAVVLHGSGKLKTLMVFPKIFKGEHVAHKAIFDVLTGHDITVEFDRPTALQIDGETVCGVTSYRATAGSPVPAQPATV